MPLLARDIVLLVAGVVIGALTVLLWFATQTTQKVATYQSYEECILDLTRGHAPGANITAHPLCQSYPRKGK
jgi:hypothetical protein